MKITLLMAAFMGAVLFTSCNKEGLNRTERLIVGTWGYDLVRKNGKKITNEYEDLRLTFFDDFSAELEDESENYVFEGTWDLVESNAGEYSSNAIFASFSNVIPNSVFQLVFSDAFISKNRIEASFIDDEDVYRYRLKKD